MIVNPLHDNAIKYLTYDLFSTVHTSNALSFADDTKCYKLILELRDSAKLQRDLNSMAIWSRDWNPFFNTNKFIHLSFNSKFPTSYFVGNSIIQTSISHRDLGIIIPTNSSWKDHYNHIIAKAYRTLGLLRQTFSHSIDTQQIKFCI